MNKLQLIDELSRQAGIDKYEARQVVLIFIDSISNALAKGKHLKIQDFCSFFVKKYKSYTGQNPKTGEKVKIKAKLPQLCYRWA